MYPLSRSGSLAAFSIDTNVAVTKRAIDIIFDHDRHLKGLILPASVLSNSKADFNCQLRSGGAARKQTDKGGRKEASRI